MDSQNIYRVWIFRRKYEYYVENVEISEIYIQFPIILFFVASGRLWGNDSLLLDEAISDYEKNLGEATVGYSIFKSYAALI